MSDSRPPVLVLGSGVTGLGVIRIMARDGLRAYGAEPRAELASSSRWFHPIPGEPRATQASLGDWLSKLPFDRAVLMPCSDDWARAVAALDPALAERFPSSISSLDTIDRFVDKGRFAQLLCDAGTPHPRSYMACTPRDVMNAPDDLFASAIVKPRDSQAFIDHFGVKAFHVSSRDAALERLRVATAAGFSVILQEYIPGPASHHYFIDGFIDRFGTVRAAFVRQRLRMSPPDFGNSTFMVSTPASAASDAVDSVTALLRGVQYRGMFSAEFKLDPRDGVFKLIEVNTRAWWYVDFAARSGVDVCRMAYEDALHRPVESVESYAVGRKLVYPYYDFFACVDLRRSGKLSLRGWAKSWIGAIQPVFQMSDPMPAMRSAVRIIAKFFGRRLREAPAVAFIVSLLTANSSG